MTDAWYVIHCHPRAEAGVSANLAEDGFEVFHPEYLKLAVHARRRIKLPAPLFPCYTFVRFDSEDKETWRPINRTHGVVCVLCSTEETPLAVPTSIVHELQNSVGPAGYIEVTDETQPIRYRRGQYLRIVDGAFVGFIGTFIGSDRQRVGILLEMLGGHREVRVPNSQVTLAESPKIQKAATGPRRYSHHPFRRSRKNKGAPVTAPL